MDWSAWVIGVLWLMITLSSRVLSEICKQTDSCSCETSKLKFSLRDLSSVTTGFQHVKALNDNYAYTYRPCVGTGLPCGDNPSGTNVAICQEALDGKSTYTVGTQDSAKFFGSPDDGTLQIVYSASDASQTTRVGQVLISCSRDEKGDLEVLGTSPSNDTLYILKLKTKYACIESSEISTGSVLLIIFFVVLFVYLVGGMLFLRYVRGAQGVEIIPNREIWKELPLLIKDGFVFVARGCKADTTYSQI